MNQDAYNIRNDAAHATDYHYQDAAFRSPVTGYTALINVPHWESRQAAGYPLVHADSIPYYQEVAHRQRSVAISQAFKGLKNWLSARSLNRKNDAELTALSERELRDIGISRADVYGIIAGEISVEQVNSERDAARTGRHAPLRKAETVAFPKPKTAKPQPCDTSIVGHAA